MSNHQQIALVTGGAMGIGEAICRVLAKAGHTVVVTDIAMDEARSVARDIGGHAYEMDITCPDSVDCAAKEIVAEVGVPTILVNNVGWDSMMPFLETDEAFQKKSVDINYHGPVRVCRKFLPPMIEKGQGGRVVNIGSDAGRYGIVLETIYAGTKGAIIAFSKSLAREMARHQITVNTVCPGPTDTPALRTIMSKNTHTIAAQEKLLKLVPLGRVGIPDDIAYAVAYFASPEAGFCTGQTLSVSGGVTMAG